MTESTAALERDLPAAPWFPFLAGPIVGILHEAIGYLMVSQSCSEGFPWFSIGAFSGIRVLMLILDVAAEIVLIAAIIAGYAGWRRYRGQRGSEAFATAAGRASFMALVGAVMSAGFMLYVLYAGLPVFFLNPCHFL